MGRRPQASFRPRFRWGPAPRRVPQLTMSSRLKQYIWAAAIMAIALVFVMQFRPGAQMQAMGSSANGPTCAIENDGRCIASMSDFVTAMHLASSGSFDSDDAKDRMRGLVM